MFQMILESLRKYKKESGLLNTYGPNHNAKLHGGREDQGNSPAVV